jgi:hypothetical protein
MEKVVEVERPVEASLPLRWALRIHVGIHVLEATVPRPRAERRDRADDKDDAGPTPRDAAREDDHRRHHGDEQNEEDSGRGLCTRHGPGRLNPGIARVDVDVDVDVVVDIDVDGIVEVDEEL